ncbi:MAG: carboxypeptidase regulatory-like domain-containing protein [Micavibrio sp.]
MAGIVISGAAPTARAQLENETPEELILAVRAGQYNLSSGILVYQYQNRNYLPIIELSTTFDFFIEPDLGRGAVSGWALEEDNSFAIDVQKNELVIRGQREELPDTAILPADIGGTEEMYVQQEVLNRLWPVALAVNLPALSLDVMVDGKLPFMIKAEREDRQKIAEARKQATLAPKVFEPKANPYRIYGLPVADIEMRHVYAAKEDVLSGQTTITGVQDLLWASANYSGSFAYNEGRYIGPDAIRLRFDRESTEAEPLPLDLERIEVGDTRVRHSPLINNGTAGRGILVTSSERKRDGEFDAITIEGTGPIGWDVELYRNAELIEFSVVDERGEYRFEDVSLNFGNNVIRTVLYGPQGQIRETTENYLFGSNMLSPGQFNYTLGAVDAEKDFFRLRKEDDSANTLEGTAVSGEVAYGLNRNITVFGTMTTLPTTENRTRRDYLTMGAGISLPFGAVQAEAYQDVSRDKDVDQKGRAVDIRFITDLLGFKLNLRNALFSKFESPDSGYGDQALKRESEIGIQRNIALPFGSLGLNLDFADRKRQDGSSFSTLSTRQSIGYSGIRLAHTTSTNLSDRHHQSTTGQLTASARMKKWQLRSALSYDAFPERQLSFFDGELLYKASEKFSASVNGSYDFPNKQKGAGFRLNYDFEKFIGSLEGLWSANNGAQITVRATTSLGPYGSEGQYIMSSDRLTSASVARANIFMDKNADGVYDEGDLPIAEARVRINNRNIREESNENGVLVAMGGSGVEDVNIEIDEASLFDPYFRAAKDGYRTTLRPGSFPTFDFPVIETGAIDGTVSRLDGEAVQGMKLELVNAEGAVIQITETAYDGFYTFEYVPPGTYVVRADPSYGVDVPPQTIVVASEELFASGIDLQLLEPSAGAEAAEQAEEEREDGEVAQPNHVTDQPVSPSASVQRVRIGEHPDSVRLVLDLSGSVPYRLITEEAGALIIVELPGTAWDAEPQWQSDSMPLLSAYETEALPEGGMRLKLVARDTMKAGANGILEPEGGQGYRLYIDLVPVE